MTRTSKYWPWNLHPLVAIAFLLAVEALVAVWLYRSPDGLWGRPLTDDVETALFLAGMGVPGLAIVLASWTFQPRSEATAAIPKRQLLLGRGLLLAFLLAPLVWSAVTLVGWYEGRPALPVYGVYLFCGVQALAYVLFLVSGVVIARRGGRPDVLVGMVG